jgi:hypothetical protein
MLEMPEWIEVAGRGLPAAASCPTDPTQKTVTHAVMNHCKCRRARHGIALRHSRGRSGLHERE